MSKISELGPITGANTRPEDLFVIVNLIQGDDGTKNITRKELVEAIQYEIFSRITITGGNISGVNMRDSVITNVTINDSDFNAGRINSSVIVNSEFNQGAIADSDFNEGRIDASVIENSEFNQGQIDESEIENSDFNAGTITDSDLTDVMIFDSYANNMVLENSFIDNAEIAESLFRDGRIANTIIEDIFIEDSILSNVTILDSRADNLDVTNSDISNTTFYDGELYNIDLSNSSIINSDFSDGTGNNNIFINTTVSGIIQDSVISNTSFTGTMDNVEAQNLRITSSSASNTGISQSVFDGGDVINSNLTDFDMDLTKKFDLPNIDENSYFALKNMQTGETEQFTYRQFFDEISKSVEKKLKIHVAVDGDDSNPGSILQPVKSLERAFELALEKAGGVFDRNDVNNAVHISCGPGTYYTKGNLKLPDDCSISSTSGQYATVIELEKGYENNNGILVGSGCYVQGFSFQNFVIDNFDYPEGGFAIAYRPGAKLLRSPYIRDCSQLSNFNRLDVEPPLQPFNSKGTIADLGTTLYLESGHSGLFQVDDEVTFSGGASGFITRVDEVSSEDTIFVRNIKGKIASGEMLYAESGGIAQIREIGPDDFPNPLVGRGGGVVLADRRVLDPDSLYTYVLCFGATPRSQNGIGYVARDGAGVNGIGSLSIFVRCAFYALNGGQMTLNNSGTQFGDISMRAKGSTPVFAPKDTEVALFQNTVFADTLESNANTIIDDVVEFITANTGNGGLGYQGYDSEKCMRDSGIIVDNVAYDIALDTNYWSRLSGITYRSPISYVVTSEQLDETAGALRHLKTSVETLFENANTAVLERANTSFSELLNVLEFGEEYANPILFADTGNVACTSARSLVQANKVFITEELIDWIENNDEFFSYDSNKCRRDIQDYILPAIKFDMLLETNYNAVTAGNAYYMATASKVLESQKDETIKAYEHLKGKTIGLLDETSLESIDRVSNGFDVVIDTLKSQTNNVLSFSDDVSIPAQKRNARKQLQANRSYIQDHIIGYINSNYFIYDSDKCRRDVQEYILPAVERDILLGTNFNSIQTGIAYYSATASEVVDEQLTETSGAVTHLKELVANNVLLDSDSINRSNAAFDEIVDIMVNGTSSANTIVWSDPAAENVTENSTRAREQLLTNRTFIQEEIKHYLKNEYFVYDGEKCKRDIGYILSAVAYDVETGSNFNSVFTGLCYRSGTLGSDLVVNDQLTQTVGAIQKAKELIGSKLSGTALTRSNTAFDEVVDILANGSGNADVIDFGTDSASADRLTARIALQLNKDFLKAEMTAWITENYPSLSYDVAKCERDVGYLIDSVSFDVQHGSNVASINNSRMYIQNAVSVLPESQRLPTANAFAHLAQVAEYIVRDVLIVPTTGNTETQDQSQSAVSLDVGQTVQSLFNIVSDYILDDSKVFPIIQRPYSYYNQFSSASQLIFGQISSIQEKVVDFINETYNGLNYNQDLCYRDTGYIVDAIAQDVEYGGNEATVNALKFYFNNAVSILPREQREPTRRAYARLADVVEQIILEQDVTPSSGNLEVQDKSGSPSDSATAARAKSLANTISMVIDDYSSEGIPLVTGAPTVTPRRTFGRQQLQANKQFLIEDVVAYLDDLLFTGYDKDKCRRDMGYIIDAVSHDIQYGGNAATLNAAGIYFENAINVLPIQQRQMTKRAFERLGDVVENVIQDYVVTPYEGNIVAQNRSHLPTSPILARRAKDLIYIIANVAEKSTVDEDFPLLVEPDTSWVDSKFITSKELIENQLESLVEDVISYISTEYDGLSFPTERCRRDIGFIVDAISHDVQYGGNTATRINAQIYFENGISVLPVDTRSQTADVYNYLSVLLSNIVQEIDTQNPLYTTTPQDFNGAPATATEGLEAQSLVGIIEQVIRDDSLASLPPIQNPDVSWVTQELRDSAETIELNVVELSNEVTDFISDEFDVLDYNKDKCIRDTNYLLDAFSFDLNYGGNAASRWNADFYFWNNVYRIPEDQRVATAKAYRKLGEICKEIVIGTYPNQKLIGQVGTLSESQKVERLANMFYLTQINNDVSDLPVLEEPSYDWQDQQFVFSKDILKKNKAKLSSETVRFVNAEYKFVDINLTRRDAKNLLKSLSNDFRFINTVTSEGGSSKSTKTYTASFFDYDGRLVFPVFNPTTKGLKFKGSLESAGALNTIDKKINWAYIVADDYSLNHWKGTVYYWDGSQWIDDGQNNIDLLEAFYKSWERMRDFIISTYSPDSEHTIMLQGLFNDVLINNVLTPNTLVFGSLVESIAHQFNGASAGVNRTALPLNFRNLGQPISALASVLSEDGGRVRWSGADELNNQYFARGLRINGRTGRIEGRPFTSSVRKLARRASNSRAII